MSYFIALRNRCSGLKCRLMLASFAAIFLVLSIMSTVQIIRHNDFLLESIRRDAKGMAGSLASNAKPWLQTADYSALKAVVGSYSGMHEVAYAMVIDQFGKVIASSDVHLFNVVLTDQQSLQQLQAIRSSRDWDTVLSDRKRFVDAIAVIRNDGAVIGFSRVILSTSGATKQLERDITTAILQTALAALLGGIIAYGCASLLTRRLGALVASADRIGGGDLDAPVPHAGGKGELDVLSSSMHQMVTALKSQIESARLGEERFQTLFESVADGLFLLKKGEIVFMNKSAERMLGPRGLICGKQFADFISCGDRNRVLPHLETVSPDPKKPSQHEFGMSLHDSSEFIAEAKIWSYDLKHDRFFVVAVRDITEQKRLEQQLIQAQKMEALGRLAGGVAHDFNNLLTVIIGYGNMLIQSSDHDKQLSLHANRILDAANKAADLTRSMLVFSRRQDMTLSCISLLDVVMDMMSIAQRTVGEDIRILASMEEHPLPIRGNAGQIGQILLNLITNARDAMPDGGSMYISASRTEIDETFVEMHGLGCPGNYVLLSVSDTGMGISKEHLEKIFDPFFTTKEVGKGTGLGLSIIFGLVRSHGGFITVYSDIGVGTTFRIYFPYIEQTGDLSVGSPPKADLDLSGTERILVAEDDDAIREIIKSLLHSAGYSFTVCANGLEAVEHFKAAPDGYDLLITDVIMPEMNGKELYDFLFAMRPGIKVLFLSGYTGDMLESKMGIGGSVAVMHKPMSPSQLLQAIRAVLDDTPFSPETVPCRSMQSTS